MLFNFRYFEVSLNRNPIRVTIKFFRNPVWYRADFKKFKSLVGKDNTFKITDSFPCYEDKNSTSGQTRSHYFMQDLYVARKIFENKPILHVDIGSRVDGFVAHVAAFRDIEVFDIRPMDRIIPNVRFRQADLMDESTLPANYCDSISSLHVLEHFGLGRYGDKIDPNGHLWGFQNITKILKPGGMFYFSVPMGEQRVDFNAHRVFSLDYLVNWVQEDFEISSFAYISDNGELHQVKEMTDDLINESCGCHFGCAIFELKKK